MTEKMQYQRWLDFPLEDPALKEELLSIKDKDEEIFDRFYQELAFGTAGLRGVLGAGTNRMNIYTVRKATQGMADYLNEKYPHSSIAISYDSRHNFRLFAEETARVMAAKALPLTYMTADANAGLVLRGPRIEMPGGRHDYRPATIPQNIMDTRPMALTAPNDPTRQPEPCWKKLAGLIFLTA